MGLYSSSVSLIYAAIQGYKHSKTLDASESFKLKNARDPYGNLVHLYLDI